MDTVRKLGLNVIQIVCHLCCLICRNSAVVKQCGWICHKCCTVHSCAELCQADTNASKGLGISFLALFCNHIVLFWPHTVRIDGELEWSMDAVLLLLMNSTVKSRLLILSSVQLIHSPLLPLSPTGIVDRSLSTFDNILSCTSLSPPCSHSHSLLYQQL